MSFRCRKLSIPFDAEVPVSVFVGAAKPLPTIGTARILDLWPKPIIHIAGRVPARVRAIAPSSINDFRIAD